MLCARVRAVFNNLTSAHTDDEKEAIRTELAPKPPMTSANGVTSSGDGTRSPPPGALPGKQRHTAAM